MFDVLYEIFRPILSFVLIGSFAFFLVSLLMVAAALSPGGKITVTVDTGADGNTSLKNAAMLTLGTVTIGLVSLLALYFI